MAKPVDQVARLLNISVGEAYLFCVNVQNHFQGAKPPFKAIAEELEKNVTTSTLDVAQGISPDLTYVPTHYKRQKISYQEQRNAGRQGRYRNIEAYERDTPAIGLTSSRPKNPLRSRTRVEQEKAQTCPHGIPYYRKCAICDPEGFAEATGRG